MSGPSPREELAQLAEELRAHAEWQIETRQNLDVTVPIPEPCR